MTDKEKILSKLEERIQETKDLKIDSSYNDGLIFAFEEAKDIVSSLLVNRASTQEVDLNLDKELDEFIETNNAFVKDDFVVEKNNGDSFNHIYDLEGVAKHFFELGLKVARKEE